MGPDIKDQDNLERMHLYKHSELYILIETIKSQTQTYFGLINVSSLDINYC